MYQVQGFLSRVLGSVALLFLLLGLLLGPISAYGDAGDPGGGPPGLVCNPALCDGTCDVQPKTKCPSPYKACPYRVTNCGCECQPDKGGGSYCSCY